MKDIFNTIVQRSGEISMKTGRPIHQTFVEWFIDLYFLNPKDIYYSDGPNDGKADVIFKIDDDKVVKFHVINSKFTKEFNKKAPPPFYAEIEQFYNHFRNKPSREEFLKSKAVKPEVAKKLSKAMEAFDDGRTTLHFLTNCKVNEEYYKTIKDLGVQVYHLEDLVQFLIDDLDGAMPKTNELTLTDISAVLSPDIRDTVISTSIVFGKLKDFINYMDEDPHDLLFARNIRLDLGNKGVNKDIKATFLKAPHEFAYSNNGITMLCDSYNYMDDKTLVVQNPRVVNGSQTLHSIRTVANPSPTARVMIRIIKVAPIQQNELPREAQKKKEIIEKISTRTNQQNPVKRWNLVANDDFQLDLFRYFRSKKLFYERREREWKIRCRDLKSRGFSQGSNIRELTQLITSYNWDEPRMGPFVARTAGDVFEQVVYDTIKKTNMEEAYQIYLLSEIVFDVYRILRKKNTPKYFNELKGYVDQVLYGIVADVFKRVNTGKSRLIFTSLLENNQYEKDRHELLWEKLITLSIKHVYDQYKKFAKHYLKQEGKTLPIANYFKNSGNTKAFYDTLPPRNALNFAKAIIRES